MKIIGIGIDIENISRFRKLPYGKNRGFYRKIFTTKEIKYCLSKPDPYQHFSARFSAKEAVIKAWLKPVNPKDIEIIRASDSLSARIKKRKDLSIFVSMSHTHELAASIVVIAQAPKST